MKKGVMIIALLWIGTQQTFSQVADQWMTSKLEGSPVGYYYMDEHPSGDEVISTLKTKLVLNRLNNKTEMTTESKYLEDEMGLQKVEYTLQMSNHETKTIAEVVAGGIKVTSSVNGASFEQMLDHDRPLYGPFSIRKMTVDRLQIVGDTLSYVTYLPEFGKILAVKRVLVNKRSTGLEVRELIEGFPESTYHLDQAGNVVQHNMRTPFGMLETRISSREVAEHAAEGTILPDEVFDQTMIRNNVRFADARSIDELVVKVSGKNKSLGLPDLAGANQEILERTDDYVIVKITRPTLDIRNISKPEENPGLMEFLQPNAYITSNDLEIQRVADSIATGNIYEDCLNLRDWVSQNMNFDLGIVLAPASEVMKNKKGTCSEYTTLLTSLYRANELPARMALGFVYMGGIWGGHAWPEVYIDDQWVPFDAAIPGRGVADAARLRFAASSLANGPGELNGKSGIQMYGNAIIETLSYKMRGKERSNTGDLPYAIVGEQYDNEGLGLQVSIPASFSFKDQDGVWPESRFLTVDGPTGEKVSFYQRSIRPGEVLSEEMKKAVVDLTGAEVKKRRGALQAYDSDGEVFARSIPLGNEYILVKYEGANAKKLANRIDMRFTN